MTPLEIVNTFLAAAAKRNYDVALPLLAEDVEYQNMPIPAVKSMPAGLVMSSKRGGPGGSSAGALSGGGAGEHEIAVRTEAVSTPSKATRIATNRSRAIFTTPCGECSVRFTAARYIQPPKVMRRWPMPRCLLRERCSV